MIARCTRGAASLCSHGYTDSNSTRIDASDEDDGEEKTAGLLLHYDLRGTLPRPGQPTQMGRQLQWFIRLELTPPTINPGRQTLGPRTAEQHLLGCLTLPSLPRLVALIALIRVLLVPAKEKLCDLLLPTIPDPPSWPITRSQSSGVESGKIRKKIPPLVGVVDGPSLVADVDQGHL